MAEYIDREEFLERIKPYDTSDKTDKALYNFALNKMMGTPTADVVEREKIDEMIEEIEQTLYVDSLIFGELIDFKNGKIDADDVIEEFNRVTRMEVLRIIDKYKLESEDKE